MFESFVNDRSYASVKSFWDRNPTRRVDPHTVESWKSAFEGFGLLYVLAGQDEIQVTPGGRAFHRAANSGDDREFAWVGINLLHRYPLKGKTGRRSRGEDFARSDLLLYRFLHAALIELDGFWQQEVFRVLAHVFRRDDAQAAIDLVRRLRAGQVPASRYPDPSGGATGAVYNALNQVLVQGGLNHMLYTSSRLASPYTSPGTENWWAVDGRYQDLVELALGMRATSCSLGTLVDRLPTAPSPADEAAYFAHVGAAVTPLSQAIAEAAQPVAPLVDLGGEQVLLLTEGAHFTAVDETHFAGPSHVLCTLAVGQRIIRSGDLAYTHIVQQKELRGSEVLVTVRRGRPITAPDYVRSLFGEADSD